MERYRILVSAPYMQLEFDKYDFAEEFEKRGLDFDLHPVRERLDEKELLEVIDKYHGVICGDDAFTPAVIDRATKLKAIIKWGTGIDSINREYAESKGIAVRNNPGAFTEPVSDTIMALILAFSRNVLPSFRLMQRGEWSKPEGKTIGESVVGIIGVGNIGKAVARKCKGFGAKVYGADIKDIPAEFCREQGIEMITHEELFRRSDYIAMACDLNPTSRYLINSKTISLMKKSAVLINTARGSVVNEKELTEALIEGRIAGAGLDVFEKEPLSENSELRKMSNVILSAHSSNSSPFYWEKVHYNCFDMLTEELRKEEKCHQF